MSLNPIANWDVPSAISTLKVRSERVWRQHQPPCQIELSCAGVRLKI